MTAPVSLQAQQAEAAAEPELDAVAKAYQEQIQHVRNSIPLAEEDVAKARTHVRELKRQLVVLNRRFQRHVEDMKPGWRYAPKEKP
jgi:chromosome segregation ATPase